MAFKNVSSDRVGKTTEKNSFPVRRADLDNRIALLMDLSDSFVFIEYYTHTNSYMYKILNPYTDFGMDKYVLCSVGEGISKAVDLAIDIIRDKRDNYNG